MEEKKSNEGNVEREAQWSAILRAGVAAQRLVPGAVCVGGTAASLYAGHRISYDTDHLVTGLRGQFKAVRAHLEAQADWKTARVQPPVLILGRLAGVEVGFRQLKRSQPVETRLAQTPQGPLLVPTLDELICMKAFLAYNRNVTRDYLDFAALSECAAEPQVLSFLLKLDERYAGMQSHSVGLEVAKSLSACTPYDLNPAELPRYKGLAPKWHSWTTTREICQRYGILLVENLLQGGD